MIVFGLLMLAGSALMAWFGGPAAWLVAAVYGAAAIELLWFQLHLRYLRRQADRQARRM